jgi:acyl-CoA synthetase (AMP-forming)/AMP-acid ligase II
MMAGDVDALLAELPPRLSEIPRRWAAATPEAPALSQGGLAWTWRELAAAVDQAIALLRRLDVRAGDRVMIVGENCAAQIALIFAAAELDAWSVNVNARLSPREIDAIREHSGARRLIYTVAVSPDAAAHAERHGAAREALPLLGELALGALNAACTPEPVAAAGADQVAALVYTTGTTGHPKGVMLTHRNLLYIAAVSSRLRRLTPADRVYGVLPISHVYGLASVTLGTLFAGASLHVVPRYSPQALIDALEHEGITVLQGVPAMYARLLEYARGTWSPANTRLRFLYAGGSPLDQTLKDEVERFFGQTLHNGYGMTETSPTISQTRVEAPRRDTSVGPAIPGIELRIVDRDGRDVADGEPGELWVRGPNVMKGYYREPELTADVMRPGGWLNTGDVARRDPDGALFIVGRTKELIIRSGFNVYPVEVEAALNSHPAVTQSAVVGREVEDGNEEVVAFVELDPMRPVGIDELQRYLAERLAPYKCPSEIVVMQAMPAAATGKILKGQLKEQAQRMYRSSQDASADK